MRRFLRDNAPGLIYATSSAVIVGLILWGGTALGVGDGQYDIADLALLYGLGLFLGWRHGRGAR